MSRLRIHSLFIGIFLLSPLTVTQAQQPASTAIWRFMGIPQGLQRVRDVMRNRRANGPELEQRDLIKRIADPEDLESDNSAIKKVTEIKKFEGESGDISFAADSETDQDSLSMNNDVGDTLLYRFEIVEDETFEQFNLEPIQSVTAGDKLDGSSLIVDKRVHIPQIEDDRLNTKELAEGVDAKSLPSFKALLSSDQPRKRLLPPAALEYVPQRIEYTPLPVRRISPLTRMLQAAEAAASAAASKAVAAPEPSKMVQTNPRSVNAIPMAQESKRRVMGSGVSTVPVVEELDKKPSEGWIVAVNYETGDIVLEGKEVSDTDIGSLGQILQVSELPNGSVPLTNFIIKKVEAGTARAVVADKEVLEQIHIGDRTIIR